MSLIIIPVKPLSRTDMLQFGKLVQGQNVKTSTSTNLTSNIVCLSAITNMAMMGNL